MSRGYSPSSYDDNFCLKPPLLLWLAALYLARACVFLLASGLAVLSRAHPETVAMLHEAVTIYALIPSLIAAPVLYALVFRAPSSPQLVRWIWAHGRSILLLAAILDCMTSLAGSGLLSGDVSELAVGLLLTALLDVYFLVYILVTRRIRDVFGDFPPPDTSRRGKSGGRRSDLS